MDRSISQALRSLVPALSDPIPTELLELASSLLAQSRSKASSLKAEEEIARSYVCANIACERYNRLCYVPLNRIRRGASAKKLTQIEAESLTPQNRASSSLPSKNLSEVV